MTFVFKFDCFVLLSLLCFPVDSFADPLFAQQDLCNGLIFKCALHCLINVRELLHRHRDCRPILWACYPFSRERLLCDAYKSLVCVSFLSLHWNFRRGQKEGGDRI